MPAYWSWSDESTANDYQPPTTRADEREMAVDWLVELGAARFGLEALRALPEAVDEDDEARY